MPHSMLPRRWRITIRWVLAALYVATLAAGVTGVLFTPQTIVGTLGEDLTYAWTGAVALGSLAALYGVAKDAWPRLPGWGRTLRQGWQIEWVAVWLIVAGFIAYAITVWGLVLDGAPTRATQGNTVTALVVALALRGVLLAAHSATLRVLHRQSRR